MISKRLFAKLFLTYYVIRDLVYTKLASLFLGEIGSGSRIGAPLKVATPWRIRIGRETRIGEHCWLNCQDPPDHARPCLEIGDSTFIGRFCHINAFSQVIIESNVLVADRVHISDATHLYEDTMVPIRNQGDTFVAPVYLREGCWIGTGVTILPGVEIGRNAVVAANSVVRSSVPDYVIAAGNPARPIKRLDGVNAAPVS